MFEVSAMTSQGSSCHFHYEKCNIERCISEDRYVKPYRIELFFYKIVRGFQKSMSPDLNIFCLFSISQQNWVKSQNYAINVANFNREGSEAFLMLPRKLANGTNKGFKSN